MPTNPDAPINNVWSTIRNFHDFSWAPNVITKCEKVGELRGDQIGAQRILNEVFHETLLELSDINYSIRYSLDDGPAPVSRDDVSHYIGYLRLFPVTDRDATFVEWSSEWEGSEEAACDFCHNIYMALLGDLNKLAS